MESTIEPRTDSEDAYMRGCGDREHGNSRPPASNTCRWIATKNMAPIPAGVPLLGGNQAP
eukprot:7441956-Pyramimonas_sp.AAC.1